MCRAAPVRGRWGVLRLGAPGGQARGTGLLLGGPAGVGGLGPLGQGRCTLGFQKESPAFLG